MEYHLDRTIRFAREEEFKNLYQWSLQEFTSDGDSVGGKQIPWAWTLRFSASEVRLLRDIEVGTNFFNKPMEPRNAETIQFTLYPRDNDGDRAPDFSMFGTGRSIKSFTLTVRVLDDDATREICSSWGIVSYTAEIDFSYETTEDVMGFELFLSPRNFADLRQATLCGSGEYAVLFSISGVEGFYSEWSPSIHTRSIKVLTGYNEHEVALPEGIEAVPRLGNVASFQLNTSRRTPLAAWPLKLNSAVLNDEDEPAPSRDVDPEESDNIRLLRQLDLVQKSIAGLRVPIWLVLIVLVALLFQQ
jgi:hypothetical protein